jgi:hypothetical protein
LVTAKRALILGHRAQIFAYLPGSNLVSHALTPLLETYRSTTRAANSTSRFPIPQILDHIGDFPKLG